MSDDPVKQAIIELQDLVRCRCHPAYKDRNLHDPDCHCEDADNVALVAARIEELEAKLAKAVEGLDRIAHASDVYGVEANAEDQGACTLAYAHKLICNLARAALAELKGDKT